MLRSGLGRYLGRLGGPTGAAGLQTPWRAAKAAPTTCRSALPTRPSLTSQSAQSRQSLLRSARRDFHQSSQKRASNQKGSSSAKEPSGLSARLKKLSREYGWAAVGVYLGLSVLDFPFCFLLVRIVGTDKIGELEHWVVSHAQKLIPAGVQEWWHNYRNALKQAERENLNDNEISEHVEMAGWGVEEASARHKAEASLGTQLALAYAIHKTFIFVRVPLTAAITPKVVKKLRSWGWDIGKRKSKKSAGK